MANPALTIDVTGQTTKFDKAMKSIGDTADQKVAEIEQRFADFDPQLNTENYTKSLTSMVAGFGIVGVGVAAVFDLVVKLNKSLADTASLADRVGISTDRLQQLRFGANALGVGDDDVNRSLDQFATNLQNAKFTANDLTRVFAANGVALKDSNGQLKTADTLLQSAFDIIKRAPTIQDAIQIGGFLGFSKELSQSLKEAGDQFLLLASQANAAGAVVDKATIEKAKIFTDEWNKASAIWGTQLKAAVADILPLLNDAVSGAVTIINAVKTAYNFISAIKDFAISPNIDTASLNQLNGLLKQYEDIKSTLESGQKLNPIQLFQGSNAQDENHQITIASVDAMIQAIKGRIDVFNKDPKNRIHITADDNPNPSKNPGPQQDESHFDRAVAQIEKRTATINADTAATFQNNAAQAQFRAEFQLLTEIMRDHGEVTQTQIDNYERLRQTMTAQQALEASGITLTQQHSDAFLKSSGNIGTATTSYDKARISLNQINSASSQVGAALSSAFADAVVEGKNLGDVLNTLLKTLEKMAINFVFAQLFNAPASGGLSPIASFFGIGHNAGGTDNWRGGPTWINENTPNPEIVNLPRGSQIIPSDVAGRRGSSGMTVQYNIDAAGADSGTVARIRDVLAAHSKAIAGQASALSSAQYMQSTGVSR